MRIRTVAWTVVGLCVVAGAAWALLPHEVSPDGRELHADDFELDDDRTPNPPAFDPAFPSRVCDGLEVNDSSATFAMAVIAPVHGEEWLDELHPSYAAAVAANRSATEVLPSLNAIDGKAKQFDDGLVAALDLAHLRGVEGRLAGHVALVRRILDHVGPSSPAAPFLAAALDLAGEPPTGVDASRMRSCRDGFFDDELRSKPIGYYSWSEPLSRCFRVVRFLGTEFYRHDPEVGAIAAALAEDASLRADYEKAIAFLAHLTNPPSRRTMTRLADAKPDDLVAFLPAASMREDDLFARLFPDGIPPSAGFMKELIRRVRSGEVDLTPRADGGWYDRQTYALETLLVTEKSEEHAKLALAASYKERLLRAFASLLTKRRETHAAHAQILLGDSGWELPRAEIHPRLRLEPCLTYYLRTARAYGFLADFLESAVGTGALRAMHGLRAGGERPLDLASELQTMRELFYGSYLVAAQDLGMAPRLDAEEAVDSSRCRETALAWLAHAYDDPELAADTRVCIPIAADPMRGVTRTWATVGVRLLKLRVSYDAPPQFRAAGSGAAWSASFRDTRESRAPDRTNAVYLIPVDDFAEFELPRCGALSREEFRAVCDREKTRDRIVDALERPPR